MSMRMWGAAVLLGSLLELTACGPGAWIHPTKTEDDFAADYNKCNADVMKDPKLQQGSTYLTTTATERCMKKKGWMIKGEEN